MLLIFNAGNIWLKLKFNSSVNLILKRKGSSFSLSDHRPEASLPAVVRCEICKYPKLVNI